MSDQNSRTEALYGPIATARLQKARILLVGLGGVGLYALEALARAGIKNYTLVDPDTFEASNLNRQLYALPSTLGQPKVQVAKERILSLHPDAQITIHQTFLDEASQTDFLAPRPDYIIDAIDSIQSKASLARLALKENIPIIISLGTARRKDPTQIAYAKLGKTTGCPLARELRRLLRDIPESKDLLTVFSKEPPQEIQKGQPLPSASTVPAAAGLALAAHVINTLAQNP